MPHTEKTFEDFLQDVEEERREEMIIAQHRIRNWIVGIVSFLIGVGATVFIGSFIVPLLG